MSCLVFSKVLGFTAVLLAIVSLIVGIIGAASKIPPSNCKSNPLVFTGDEQEAENLKKFDDLFALMSAPMIIAALVTFIGAGLHLAGAFGKNKPLHCSSSFLYAVALIALLIAAALGFFLSGVLNVVCDGFECGGDMSCGLMRCDAMNREGTSCCKCQDEGMEYVCENQHQHMCNHMKSVQDVISAFALITAIVTFVATLVPCAACCCCPELFEMDGKAGVTQYGGAPVPSTVVGQPIGSSSKA